MTGAMRLFEGEAAVRILAYGSGDRERAMAESFEDG